jgi:hypothetical protein
MNASTSIENLLSTEVENDIDQLVLLDKQIKELDKQLKVRKDAIANKYGIGKFQGTQYSVTVRLDPTSKVDYAKLLAELGCSADQKQAHTTTGASIKVFPQA